MLRLLVVVALLASAGSAAADHLEPEKRIRPADQARAKAMLLRPSDLPSFTRLPPSSADPHMSCRALDASDLTVTGDAETPLWSAGVVFVASSSTVYETAADATASWRRETSTAGTRCLRRELGKQFAKQGASISTLRRVAFPKLAQDSAAYRLVLTSTAQGQTVTLTLDVVALKHGRATVGLVVGTALVPPVREAELRLARTLEARMAKAMRGA